MIDINGIAHFQLSVRDFAKSRAFYHALCHETFGMAIQYDDPRCFYCIGGRTGLMITPVDPEYADTEFDQRRVGLHHICFRLRSEDDVRVLHDRVVEFGAKIIRAPEYGPWAEGYYSILFEDPDGIRLEANFVPGKGNLPKIEDAPLAQPTAARDQF
ncbi:MAG: VOC family protein [Pseudomonadota bacterium]